MEILNAAGMPTAPVYTAADIFADEHFRTRKMLVDLDDPDVGTHTFARTTPHLSAAPDIPLHPAPRLGQDTPSILEELGYGTDDINQLVGE